MSKYLTPKNVARVLNFGQKAYNVYNSPGVRTLRGVAKNQRTRIATNRARATRNKGFGGASSAAYAGPFNKPRRAKTSKIAKYLSQGSMEYKEVYGDVNDPDAVYLTFSTFDKSMIRDSIQTTIYKKLLKKAGINMDAYNQEIPASGFNDSAGFVIRAVYKSSTGALQTVAHITVNNETMNYWIAIDAIKFTAWFISTVEGTNTSPFTGADWQLERVAIYALVTDTNGGIINTANYCLAELNVMQEVLQIESMATIAIQNRTKSAVAGTGDSETDRVDSQPLQGKLYEFSGGVPKERQKGYSKLNAVTLANGVGLNRAGQLNIAGDDLAYHEPPPAKHFSNITKCSNQLLQPGTIKKHYISWYARGFLNNLVMKWRAIINTSAVPSNQVAAPGKCCMFAFEELLNSGSTNKITVNYEVDRKVGSKLITAKPAPMKPRYQEATYSNVVA